MKKNIVKAVFVAAVAVACGLNVFNSQESETLSEVTLANVEALADFVMNPTYCTPRPDCECGVLQVLPDGSYGEIYYDQINKSNF